MNKNKAKLCFWISAVLAVIFLVKNPLDYIAYSNTLNSAPFWVTILVNGIYFLIPAVIVLICGFLLRKRDNR